ncbi:MAG: hypothetical protein FWH54_06910 [Methanobrevibacter sp.]|nr:hypothetical protein [Methanobrevibacter sp.]
MTKTNNDYTHIRLRVLPSHDRKIQALKDNINSEFNIVIFKNDIVRIAISEFLENNQDMTSFKKTLEKNDYI